MSDFDNDALAAAAESATVKALTGDPGTDIYAQQGLTGWDKLADVRDLHQDWASAYLDDAGRP